MWNTYVEGYTSEVDYCPFCGKSLGSFKADGSCVCENDECNARFYVIEDEDQ